MKHYKDIANNLFGFEDGAEVPAGLIEITIEEVHAINDAADAKAFDNLSYSVKRSREYPAIANYLDGIVKGDQAQIDKYIADCLAVKAKYPKP